MLLPHVPGVSGPSVGGGRYFLDLFHNPVDLDWDSAPPDGQTDSSHLILGIRRLLHCLQPSPKDAITVILAAAADRTLPVKLRKANAREHFPEEGSHASKHLALKCR